MLTAGFNLVFEITLIVVFITIFFFTYVSSIEENIVIRQVDYLVNNFSADMNLILDETTLTRLRAALQSIRANKSEDESVARANEHLKTKSYRMLTFVLLAGGIITLVGVYFFQVNVQTLLLSNLSMVGLIALVEYCFSTFIAQNYLSLDENYAKLVFIHALKTFAFEPSYSLQQTRL